jgi:hypothetical protein|tara:strand:+ start:1969 stop:2169 length:201 start_codon:yes stop_codon:yes gene_type:complete
MKLKLNPKHLASNKRETEVRVTVHLDGYKYDGCDKKFSIKDDKSLWYMIGYLQFIYDNGGEVKLSN